MSLLAYLPLGLALALMAVVSLAAFVERIDRAMTGIALRLFRDVVEEWGFRAARRKRLLQAVHATMTYPVYASRALLFSLVSGVVAVVLGAYGTHAALSFMVAHEAAMREALPRQLHFVVDPDPDLGLPALGGSGGGGGLPVGLSGQISFPVPRFVVRTVGTVVGLIPEPLRPSMPNPAAGSGASSSGPVEVLIVFPRIDLVPDALARLSPIQLLLLAAVALLTGGAVAAVVYVAQWYDVENTANNRETLIDESMARTIAFVFALSRSEMLFPEIFRTVGENRRAFGESAEEIGVVVKEIDLLGTDLVTALHRTARWTPSEQFAEFLENFANVLQSGRNVSAYLRDQYEQYQEERVANQEQLLELFAALGEGYVAVLVAGPLFLITILTIFGMLTGGMLVVVQLLVYLWIPVANIGFVLYVGSIGEPLSAHQPSIAGSVERRPLSVRRSDGRSEAVADGGHPADVERNLRRFELYNRLRRFRWTLKRPVETVATRPVVLLYLTVPLALASVGVRWWLAGDAGLRAIDDWVIQATLFVAATFAVVQEVHARRLRNIEAAIPDFLDSLASTNEAGATFTESLRRIDRGEYGALDDELRLLLADIEWGGRTEQALEAFSQRLGSPTITRVVALITNALRASGHIGPVIRIAADEARQDRLLKRQRRQEMFMYVVIVYIAFAVFLGIAATLKVVLVPAIPSAEQMGSMAGAGGPGGFTVAVDSGGTVEKAKYTLVLFHGAVLQAVLSGAVAGKMGEGSVKNGAKHVAIMLAAAYGAFVLLG